MALTKLNARSASALDATILTGNLPAISGASLTGISAGITTASVWRLTTSFAGDVEPIASNLEQVDDASYENLGSAMVESSGVFTFPSTGIYLVTGTAICHEGSSTDNFVQFDFYYNSVRLFQIYHQLPMADGYTTGTNSALVDVTDVAQTGYVNYGNADSPATELMGNSTINLTSLSFIRLGDT